MSQDARVGHAQLGCRVGLTAQHDPTETHLCVHLEDGLRQLHLVELAVHVQRAGARRRRHRVHARPHTLDSPAAIWLPS
jgi:hypothetical protein